MATLVCGILLGAEVTVNGNCSVTAHLVTLNSETRDFPAAAAENGFLQKLLRRQAAELKDLAEASRGREVHPNGG